MPPLPWVAAANNNAYVLRHSFKDRFLEAEGYDDDYDAMGSFVALVVDEVNVGQTKHVKLRVLGASNKDYWDWVQNGDHPNPGWYYCTAKKLKDSKAAKVCTDKTEPSLPLACFRELDACDGPTLDLGWVIARACHQSIAAAWAGWRRRQEG
jgi:hypothetical protein